VCERAERIDRTVRHNSDKDLSEKSRGNKSRGAGVTESWEMFGQTEHNLIAPVNVSKEQ